MAKAHPLALRERVVAHVEEGHSHRATALHYRVSIKFVNDMIKLKRTVGSLAPKRMGKAPGDSKLSPHADWIAQRFDERGDITLPELSIGLFEQFGVEVHPTSVGRFVHRLGLSHKKRHSMPVSKTARI